MLPLRFALAIFNWVFWYLIMSVCLFSWNRFGPVEMTPTQRYITKFCVVGAATVQHMLGLVFVTVKEADFDYSKWLGKGYKTLELKKCGLYVANHVGYYDPDILAYATFSGMGFVAAEWTRDLPVVGKYFSWQEGYFVTRGEKSATQKTIDDWNLRTQKIEEGSSNKRPLCVFSEGYHQNGTHLSVFRKGAFEGLFSVRPAILRYSHNHIMPTCVALKELPLNILLFCSFTPIYCSVELMPVFTPNEHLFRQDPGKEKWEVFAESVRSAMSEYSGFPKDNHRYVDMRAYWDSVGFRKSWDKSELKAAKVN